MSVLARQGGLVAWRLVQQPLSRVPENTMKFAVGLMLATFGSFWSGEGTGLARPGADVALLGILVLLTLVSLGWVASAPSSATRMAADPCGTPR
jgi:uncharacterized membrane protein